MTLPSRSLSIVVSAVALTAALAGCNRPADPPPPPATTTTPTTPPMAPASAASQ